MNSVYKLLIQITGKDKGARRELKKTKRSVKDLDDQAKALKNTMQLAGIAGMAFMAKQAGEAVWGLAKLGAESERMESSFDDLAQRIGTSGDALLKSLNAAADGTVSDMNLMRTTAGLLASGIQTSTGDIVDAMEIAQLKAQQFGISTTEAYNRMVTGARKFSVEMLDEIGINLKAESVYRRRAKSMGVAVTALSDAEKAEALWVAILEDGRAEIEQYGGAVDDHVTKLENVEVALENLRIEAAKAWAPIVIKVIVDVEEAIGTWDQLNTIFRARFAQIAAGFQEGVDAQAVFEYEMLRSIMTEKEAAKAAAELMLARQREAEATFFAADATRQSVFELYPLPPAAKEATAAIGTLGGEFQNSIPDVLAYAQALNEVTNALDAVRKDAATVTVDELSSSFANVTGRIEGQLADLAGDVSFTALEDIRRRYANEVDALFREVADAYAEGTEMTDFELEYRLNLITNRFDEEVGVLENAALEVGRGVDGVSDAYNDLRSAVESALQATSVTAWDMQLSELGEYVDKWDENARRLDAVAEAGFAAFDAHPDWIEILKIPDEVMAGSEAGLKAWAAQTGTAVRDLTRPDLLNIDAAVAAVEQYFADMAARELSIDLVTQALVEKGVVSGADAKKQVAQALGLDQTTVGEDAGKQIFDGMIEKFSEKSAAAEFAGYLKQDSIDEKFALKGAGEQLWLATEVGILAAMDEGTYVTRWVAILLPELLAAMGEEGTWNSGGVP